MSSPETISRLVVYTGSFDPITLGHLNVIERASRMFDKIIVGVGINVEKQGLFSPEERVRLVRQTTEHLSNVEVHTFTGLAVEFVRQCDARVMIRGIRPLTDAAAEFTMMLANRELDPNIETVFLMADARYQSIASRLVKEIARLNGDIDSFVPDEVAVALRKKYSKS